MITPSTIFGIYLRVTGYIYARRRCYSSVKAFSYLSAEDTILVVF
jgi:hypothetical protein